MLPRLDARNLAAIDQGTPSAAAANPCDAAQINEICACCQGAIDVDELVGLKALGREHHHADGHQHRPSIGKAALTTWLAAPGVYFGYQNYTAARGNIAVIEQTRLSVGERMRDVSPMSQTHRNLQAYQATLQNSQSLQQFVQWYAGALPAAGALCMLGSIVFPPLELCGGALLAAYCGSHAYRYLRYERARLTALPPIEPIDARQLPMTHRGQSHVQQVAQTRSRLFVTASTCFSAYGLGATGMTVAALMLNTPMLIGSALLLSAGLATVLYINNGPIKDAYGKNRDLGIDRANLGSLPDIYRQAAQRLQDGEALQVLRTQLLHAEQSKNARRSRLLWSIADNVVWGVCMGVTFGAAMPLVRPLSHKRQQWDVRQIDTKTLHAPLLQFYHTLQESRAAARMEASEQPRASSSKLAHAPHGDEAMLQEVLHLLAPRAHQAAALASHGHHHKHGADCHHEVPSELRPSLHKLLYEMPAELEYELGALTDHAHARLLRD